MIKSIKKSLTKIFQFPSDCLARVSHTLLFLTFMLLVLACLRVAFLSWNWAYFKTYSVLELLRSMLVGVRFDLAAGMMLLIPLLLLQVLPWHKNFLNPVTARRLRKIYVAFVSACLVLPNISDIEHFHFIDRRATAELFGNPSDFFILVQPLLTQYWYLAVFAFALVAWVYYIYNRLPNLVAKFKITSFRLKLSSWLLFVLIFNSLSVLAIRGTQKRPIGPHHALLFIQNPNLATLALNSTFTILRTIKAKNLQELHFFPDDLALRRKLDAYRHFPEKTPRFDNVVILVMESMGTEFMAEPNGIESRIPFVESLAERGLLFENNFSNGGETGHSFNSIMASIPELMLGDIVGTAYSNNTIYGIGNLLKKYGYSTWFFHGGPRALFYFDIVVKNLGFDHHHSLEDYEPRSDYDGEWGIYDEPFIMRTAEKLEKLDSPFIAYFLSLSNHPPFSLPASYVKPNKPDWSAIDHTAYYADQALKKFFDRVSQFPWYKNTLFVITGDHPPFSQKERYHEHPLGRRRVPLILFHPQMPFGKGRSLRITQQVDILPSVLDFLGLADKERKYMTPFGRSVFQEQSPGLALLWKFGTVQLVSGTKLSIMSPDLSTNTSELESDFFRLDKSFPTVGEDERLFLMKGFLQYYANSLIHNKLYDGL